MYKSFHIIILSLVLLQCTSPYDFEIVGTEEILVVDASFTNEQKAHVTRLSYSFPLDESAGQPAEGATIWIESESGERITYSETDPGVYQTAPDVAGVIGESYALHISINELELTSSMETMLEPVGIDSIYGRYMEVSFEDGTNRFGVQFFVDASGSEDQARGYRYEFEETHEVFLRFGSVFEWDADQEMAVIRETRLDRCYATDFSEELLITTTNGLAANAIREFPVRFVGEDDPELRERYSMILRQYGISNSNFQFYTDVRETNESSGSFFDEQKGRIQGNISAVGNPQFPVLGYFEVAGVTTYRRVFSKAEFVPQGFRGTIDRSCEDQLDSVAVGAPLADYMRRFPERNIFGFAPNIPFPALVGPKSCTDCRLFGDINKPDFWD